jgi:predicted nuclease of predicted toxin-antitoxin system
VKLLFDENLPPRLVEMLADLYPGSVHVHQCGLGSSHDDTIWDYAKANSLTIVSKDSDFQERSMLLGCPPKVIWLRASNCTSAVLEHLLRTAFPAVEQFIKADGESCLVLAQHGKKPR